MSDIGVPVVFPSNTPDKIWTLSSSLRWVVNFDCPGFLLSSSIWISCSLILIFGGHPSTIQPIAGPWDSPQDNEKDLNNSVETYQQLLKLNNIIEKGSSRSKKQLLRPSEFFWFII